MQRVDRGLGTGSGATGFGLRATGWQKQQEGPSSIRSAGLSPEPVPCLALSLSLSRASPTALPQTASAPAVRRGGTSSIGAVSTLAARRSRRPSSAHSPAPSSMPPNESVEHLEQRLARRVHQQLAPAAPRESWRAPSPARSRGRGRPACRRGRCSLACWPVHTRPCATASTASGFILRDCGDLLDELLVEGVQLLLEFRALRRR